MVRTGNLIIVSGPSGAGKSALAAEVLPLVPNLRFSVSYTTRAPRIGERSGVEYHFVSRSEFESLIADDCFLEWAEVYGNFYGTNRRFVDGLMKEGKDVLLDIDVQGAGIVREHRADALSIFIMPPSYQVLRDRLKQRSLDRANVIEQRLRIAFEEIGRYAEYDYVIINNDLGRAADELRSIVLGSRCRMAAMIDSVQSVLDTFGGMDGEDS